MVYRPVSMMDLLRSVAGKLGLDVDSADWDAVTVGRIAGFVQERARQAWQEEFWPWGVCFVEKRFFAEPWAVDKVYAAGDVVQVDGVYYAALVSAPFLSPVDAGGAGEWMRWGGARVVGYEQAWEPNAWEDVQDVFVEDPRVNRRARPVAYDLDGSGFVVLDAVAAVWMRARRPVPTLVAEPLWAAGVGYAAGTTVLHAADGFCWTALADVAAGGEVPGAAVDDVAGPWIWQVGLGQRMRYVAAGTDRFVAVSGSTARVGFNGLVWQDYAMPVGPWRKVAFGGGLFVATSDEPGNMIASSPDGMVWTVRVADGPYAPWDVVYGNGVWCAVAYNYSPAGGRYVSEDGVNWTHYAGNVDAKRITFINGIFHAVNGIGDRFFAANPVTGFTTAVDAGGALALTAGNGVIVGAGNGGLWRRVPGPNVSVKVKDDVAGSNEFTGVSFVGGGVDLFFAGTRYGQVFVSGDGLTWDEVDADGGDTGGAALVYAFAGLAGRVVSGQETRGILLDRDVSNAGPAWVREALPRALKSFVVHAAYADELGAGEGQLEKAMAERRVAGAILDDLVDRTFGGQGEVFRADVEMG